MGTRRYIAVTKAVTHAPGYRFRRARAPHEHPIHDGGLQLSSSHGLAIPVPAAAQKELLVGALVLLIRCTAIYRRIS